MTSGVGSDNALSYLEQLCFACPLDKCRSEHRKCPQVLHKSAREAFERADTREFIRLNQRLRKTRERFMV